MFSGFIDLDRGGHAGRKDDARWHLIDMDTDRDALGQAHPCEDRVDVGDPLSGGLCVRNVDGTSDALDVTAQDLAMAHQLSPSCYRPLLSEAPSCRGSLTPTVILPGCPPGGPPKTDDSASLGQFADLFGL